MSIFTEVFKVAKEVIGKLGPVLPLLLDLIRTKTNEGDREGIIKIGGIVKRLANGLGRLGDALIASVDSASPGGTAITGNEYKEVLDIILEVEKEIKEAAGA